MVFCVSQKRNYQVFCQQVRLFKNDPNSRSLFLVFRNISRFLVNIEKLTSCSNIHMQYKNNIKAEYPPCIFINATLNSMHILSSSSLEEDEYSWNILQSMDDALTLLCDW